MPALVETMMYAKEGGVPWHGFGTAMDNAPTTREGIVAAGIDWVVEKHPLYVHTDIAGKRSTKRVPDYFATVRVSDGAILGVVKKEYQVLQNAEALSIIDTVLSDEGVEVRWETMGALRDGKEIFGAARIPKDVSIGKGDTQFPYLMIRTGHDGGTALDILPTFIRPVCWNTVTLALRERGRYGSDYTGTTLWHMGDIDEKVKATKTALKLSMAKMTEYEEVTAKLADIAATDEMRTEFERILFPPIALLPAGRKSIALLPAPDPNRWVTAVPADGFLKAQERREKKVEIFNSVFKEETQTAWGLFNAATGYADHQRPNMWRKGEAAMTSKLWGSGAIFKDTAYNGIRELAKV